MTPLSDLSRQFAALADPTRVRLLLACRDRDLLVGQCAHSLGLPEPAVSRHLAILARAGLLARARKGREVSYGWSDAARGAGWLTDALAPAMEGDAAVRRDRARLSRRHRETSTAAPFVADSLFGQRLAAALQQLSNNTASARALAVDVTQGPVLAWLQESAAALTVFATHPALRRAIGEYARERDFAFDWANDDERGAQYDLACVMASDLQSLQQSMAAVATWLVPQGSLLLGLPYDSLLEPANEGSAHPLFRLRASLSAHGFSCERLLPLELAGEHWLLAHGVDAARGAALTKRG